MNYLPGFLFQKRDFAKGRGEADELKEYYCRKPSRLRKWSAEGWIREMIENTAKIVNEIIKDRPQVARIFNSCAGGNATLIAEYKDGGQ